MDDLEYVNLSEDCIKLLGLFLPMLSMGTEVKTKPVKDFEELHYLADLEQSLSGSVCHRVQILWSHASCWACRWTMFIEN